MTDSGYTRRASAVLALTQKLAGRGEQTTEHLLRALLIEG